MKINFFISCLFILLTYSNSYSQEKKIYSIDSLFFDNIASVNSSKIILNNKEEVIISGQFLAYYTLGNPHLPFFLSNTENNNFTYYEDAFGFVIDPFEINDMYSSDKNIYLAGTVNNNKVIAKIDSNHNVVWSKKQGHHSFTGMELINQKIVITGQDENSFGQHANLISVIDTNGNLITSKNIFNNNNFHNASKVINGNDGYILTGTSIIDTIDGSNIFINSLGENLNLKCSKTFIKPDFEHEITSTLYDWKSSEIVISGNMRRNQYQDSIYILKLDTSGNVVFYNYYGNGDSLNYNTTCMDVDSIGNIFLGVSKISDLRKEALLTKINTYGDVLWTRNHTNDSSFSESVSDIHKNELYILGDHKLLDTTNLNNTQFYSLIVSTDSGYWSCDTT